MVVEIEKKHLPYYVVGLLSILLSIIYYAIINVHPIEAQGGNGIVGYNMAGYHCGDEMEVASWSLTYGNWILVLMNPSGHWQNTEIMVKDVVAIAGGKNVVVRLWSGGNNISVPDIPNYITNLKEIADVANSVGATVWIEPHNEVNWTLEYGGKDKSKIAGILKEYLVSLIGGLENAGIDYTSSNVKLLFPSTNNYPNSETISPRGLINTVFDDGRLNANMFAAVSVHMYGGGYVYMYDSDGSVKSKVDCYSPSSCIAQVKKATLVGPLSGKQVVITEMGRIAIGRPGALYEDPYTADFLAQSWHELKGKVLGAMPIIYNPDMDYEDQCNSYFLPGVGVLGGQNERELALGMSRLVAVASYMFGDGTYPSGITTRHQLIDYYLNEKGYGDPNNSTCQTIAGERFVGCVNVWEVHDGVFTMASGGFASPKGIWPEWGKGPLPICLGKRINAREICTDREEGSGNGASFIDWLSSAGDEFSDAIGRFWCYCDKIELKYGVAMIWMHAPAPMPSSKYVKARGRLGDQGWVFTVSLPGEFNYEDMPLASAKSLIRYNVTGSGAVNTEEGQKTEVEMEDYLRFRKKWVTVNSFFNLPQSEGFAESKSIERDVCASVSKAVPATGQKICLATFPTYSLAPWQTISTVGSSFIGRIKNALELGEVNPCDDEERVFEINTEAVFEEPAVGYGNMVRNLYSLPGQLSACEDRGEMYIKTSINACGKDMDAILYFPGFDSVSCSLNIGYDLSYNLPGDGSAVDAAEETYSYGNF